MRQLLSPIERTTEFYKQFSNTMKLPSKDLMIYLVMEYLYTEGNLATLRLFEQETQQVYPDFSEQSTSTFDAPDLVSSPQNKQTKTIETQGSHPPLLSMFVTNGIAETEQMLSTVSPNGDIDIATLTKHLTRKGFLCPDDLQTSRSIWQEISSNAKTLEYDDPTTDDPMKIRKATLNRFVERLTDPARSDSNQQEFMKRFLAIYTCVVQPRTLLMKIIERFNVPSFYPADQTQAIKRKVILVLIEWVTTHFEDFTEDRTMIPELFAFCDGDVLHFNTNLSRELRAATEKQMTTVKPSAVPILSLLDHDFLPTTPTNTLSLHSHTHTDMAALPDPRSNTIMSFSPSILTVPERILAEQLTLMAYEPYSKMKIPEFFYGNFEAAKTYPKCRNVRRYMLVHNRIGQLVNNIVLVEGPPEVRTTRISKLLTVAVELKRIRNFDSLLALQNRLQDTPIKRLKKSWEGIPKQQMTQFSEIATLLSPDRNFKTIKKECTVEGISTLPPAYPILLSHFF
ncbi:putative nucleotide exchange factor RasGEF A [Blattamonas nauphoetae]|uniref:Nucleotide exchange factor RasGEF A n=1 Tax=Blattamonas nauphoetae TaxID=2049346 RepID=A0ABQ9XWN5_9EUKA|nr:putative nucleotide exchange factor RasGEF A [Blattamonas nauphoetae]